MGLMKRLAEQAKPVKVSKNVTVTDATRPIIYNAVDQAVKDSAEVVKEALLAILNQHRSSVTGTVDLQSAGTRKYSMNRKPLADSVEIVSYTDEDGKIVSQIQYEADVEYIGRFLEYGHPVGGGGAMRWGHQTDTPQAPIAPMRRTADGIAGAVFSAASTSIKGSLQ